MGPRWFAALVAVSTLGCAERAPDIVPAELESAPPPERPPSAPAAASPACARVESGERPAPLDDVAGGAVALARLGDRTIAYVADDDDRALRTVDVAGQVELASTPLDGAPAAALVLGDGRVAVTLRDRASVVVLEPAADPAEPLAARCAVEVAAEPTGLTATLDGAAVLVVSRWGHALTAFDTATFERTFVVDLPRDPRAVVVSSDGGKAFVTHVAGAHLSVVDLVRDRAPRVLGLAGNESFLVARLPVSPTKHVAPGIERRRRLAGQGYAVVRGPGSRILAPQVFTDPGNGVVSGWGGYGDDITVLGDVLALDERTERRAAEFETARLGARDCLLPRAAALDAPTARLFVTCLGLDRVFVYDAAAKSPHDAIVGRLSVGAGPTGIAIDAAGRRAVVWSQFDRSLAFLDLDAPLSGPRAAKATLVALERRGEPQGDDVELGRRLFHASGDRRISFDGRSCASCHPDGRDDAITWTTPNGQRQTPMLLERLDGTAPYGWDGARKTTLDHVARTLERLSGTGISDAERRALFAYVGTLRAPVVRAAPSARVARGDELFHSEATQCSTCHLDDDAFTDHAAHDVKSHIASDLGTVAFDTPSLRLVGHSAPYFHDGRYATLEDLLAATSGTMGTTAGLSEADRAALVAYLEQL